MSIVKIDFKGIKESIQVDWEELFFITVADKASVKMMQTVPTMNTELKRKTLFGKVSLFKGKSYKVRQATEDKAAFTLPFTSDEIQSNYLFLGNNTYSMMVPLPTWLSKIKDRKDIEDFMAGREPRCPAPGNVIAQ